MTRPASIERLLENADWLRGLARQMLVDRGWSEDATQETWLAALAGGKLPEDERPWLARVLRNAIGQRARSESARGQRERRAARPEALPGTDEVVARAELFARLVQAVLALEEPYRTTILWRYFEELESEEIARRAGIDVATVRSRTKRAREKLRERLVTRDGEPPERWLAALVGTVGIGGTLVGIKQGALLALVAVVAVVFVWRTVETPERASAAPVVESAPVALERPEVPTDARAAEAPALSERLAAEPVGAPLEPAAALTGIVLSEDGRLPLADARISLRRGREDQHDLPEPRTREVLRTGADGRFRLARPELPDEGLWIEADGHFPYKLSPGDLPAGKELEVVLAPFGRLVLEVVDDLGVPVSGVAVAYEIEVNRGSKDHEWANRRTLEAGLTDVAGRLELPEVPCGMAIRLRRGGGSDYEPLGMTHVDPRERSAFLRAVLARRARIVGRLVDEQGQPSQVAVTWRAYPLDHGTPLTILPGSDGRFEFADLRPIEGELAPELPGCTPRVALPRSGETLDLGTLVVPALARLEGRIVSRFLTAEARAAALAGFEARVFHGASLVAELGAGEHFELELAGGPLELLVSRGGFWFAGLHRPDEVLARLRLPGPASGLVIDLDATCGAVELELGPEAAEAEAEVALWPLDPSGNALAGPTRTDAAGNLRVPLVLPGRYRASVTRGSEVRTSEPFAVEAGVLRTLALPAPRPLSLRGVVRSAQGVAVGGAELTLGSGLSQVQTSAPDGTFRFDDLAPGRYRLAVRHDEFGRLVRDDLVLFEPDAAPLELTLSGFATLVGRITANGEPVRGLELDAQPVANNDLFHALTDDDGRFRFERLMPCRLRFWSQGRFVQVTDLAGGETRTVEIELGTRRTLRFTRAGVPLAALYAHALGLDGDDLAARHWRSGQPEGDGFAFDLPPGRILFELALPRAGSQESLLAVALPAGDSVELEALTLSFDAGRPWEGPVPTVTFLALDGVEVIDRWGRSPELLAELVDGVLRVPCLPRGARLAIDGFDGQGARRRETLELTASQRLSWP